MDATGRTALVTGGGTGIGRAAALALAGAGAEVIVTGRRAAPLEDVAALSPRIRPLVMDVCDEAGVDAAFAAGPVDILVANAGIAPTAPVHKLTLDHWREVQRTNVEGVMLSMRAALPGMKARGWGRIIVVSSVAGLRGFRYTAAYSASKHAVIGLMKCAAEETLTTGVTVNAVCPGYVLTDIVAENIEKIAERSGVTRDEAEASLRDQNPFGRLIEPEEIADAILWLAGPNAGAVTGQAIPVSGGHV